MPRYSETVMDHFQDPRNWGKLDNAERVGVAGIPGRGRYLVMHLRLDEGQISEARFQCHGCGATIASGSVLTEHIVGRSLDQCRELEAADIIELLDGLPPDKQHAAGFALLALKEALND